MPKRALHGLWNIWTSVIIKICYGEIFFNEATSLRGSFILVSNICSHGVHDVAVDVINTILSKNHVWVKFFFKYFHSMKAWEHIPIKLRASCAPQFALTQKRIKNFPWTGHFFREIVAVFKKRMRVVCCTNKRYDRTVVAHTYSCCWRGNNRSRWWARQLVS